MFIVKKKKRYTKPSVWLSGNYEWHESQGKQGKLTMNSRNSIFA